ncbi:preprotein translocase subunit SecE [Dialister pneumosintes]|uniref:Protein translocase subunit SecE n=1 Tax=Dialister pneumosintes TaxID=39950 RepID=A0A1B3WCE3_9FIRM|nr:preprotein translocase subunit SecE [Dialister pneumosintes]AOH38638.1 preprotein translocase subunit SecE [Dialister pneumosintes]MBS6480879.1 preprotein translocase subunit SecE [Dialister sp.]RID94410.1 preprotein translocase subunit SecE [Dialister pneumosintes]CDF27048.1 preprotein translocase [Dialister sp. CAG:588]
MAKRQVSSMEEKSSTWTRFFRETKMEMKKVNWPTKTQLIQYTATVITSVVLVSFLIVIVDFAFMQLSKLLVTTIS